MIKRKKHLIFLVFIIFAAFLLLNVNTQDYLNPDLPISQRVSDLLLQMNLDEKVGQMVMTEYAQGSGISPQDVADYYLGCVFNRGGSYPAGNSPEAWCDMYDSYQAAALDTRLGIPILYGYDAVHGNATVYGATVFPHNIGLAAANDPALMQEIGTIVALESTAAGLDWIFAPAVAFQKDCRSGRYYEGPGENISIHNQLIVPYINSIQGGGTYDDYMESGSVLATAKHNVGDGASVWGTGIDGKIDQGDIQIDPDPHFAFNDGLITTPLTYTDFDVKGTYSSAKNSFQYDPSNEDFTWYSGPKPLGELEGSGMGYFDDGDWLSFKNIDFDTGTFTSIRMSLACDDSYAGQQIEIRADSTGGTLLGTLTVQGTGSWYNYQQQTTSVSPLTGLHDIYLLGAGSDGIANLDWFMFEQGSTPEPTPEPTSEPTPTGGETTYLADSDMPVAGTVTGNFIDTHVSDDGYESIQERESGGKPSNRYTYLEHKWTISVNGGSFAAFYVEACQNASPDGDHFEFYYSLNNQDYTYMLTVTKTSDDDTEQSFVLPALTPGTVYIRVIDTDRTPGHRDKDTIYVDSMKIVCTN